MTTNRNDLSADQRKPDEQKKNEAGASADSANHRLRGKEQAADFSDAEGDSCIVARKRDEKESDS